MKGIKLLGGIITLCFVFFNAGGAQAGLRDGLILHYSFDADNGVVVLDESGNNHIGSVMGAVYTPNGRFNGAYSFDGMDDYILAGDLGFQETGTISFWMNAAVVENWRNPFSTRYADWDDNIRFEENSKGEFSGGGHGLGRGDIFTRALEPNRWYHVTYIWDQNYVYGYLDGDLKFRNPHPDPASKVHPDLLTAGEYKARTLNFSNVAIGNGYSISPDRYWKGLIDEVRMYNRPLTAGEVRLLAQGRADGLILHYTFDTDNGSIVLDESGFGNNGAVSGAVFSPEGRIGGAYRFDGVDEIFVPANPSLNLGDELTLAAWFYVTDTNEQPIIEWSEISTAGVYMGANVQWLGLGTGVNLADTTHNEFISTDNPPINQWHHLAVSYSKSTGKAQLYLDGIPVVEKILGKFTPLTNLPLHIGRTKGNKSLNGLIDDIRIYNKALSPADVRAMYDSLTHGKIYQNFELDNGTDGEYGWAINGVTVAASPEQKHAGSYSWKVSIPSTVSEWYGGTGVKSQVEHWHLNAEPQRHDRLTFWILANPLNTADISQIARVKFFDHEKYFTNGFVAQTLHQYKIGAWTKMSILFSQLPLDFNLQDIDKIEIYQQVPGTYYIDDIEITSADRVYQAFEKRPGALTVNYEDYAWPWFDNTSSLSLSTLNPAEGKQALNLETFHELGSMAGAFIKYQEKWFTETGTFYDIWEINMSPKAFKPPLYRQMTFFYKQLGDNKLANNVGTGFFDHGSYFTQSHQPWSNQRSDYGQWAKITIPFQDFPADFNLTNVNKIEMGIYWPGQYYFDDIRVTKYPELCINENLLPDGLVSWPEHPGAVKYVLERSTSSALGPWSTLYSGPQALYQTSSLVSCWFRLRWESDANTQRGTVAYISDWCRAVFYEPRAVLIDKSTLDLGFVEWTFIPQASLYEIQKGNTKFGPWTLIYQGGYKVPPPLSAKTGKWYRARAIQKNKYGAVIAKGSWSPALLCDPLAFVTAEGTAVRQKKGSGNFLKLSGVNLGNYFLLEPWMFLGYKFGLVTKHDFETEFPDDGAAIFDWLIGEGYLARISDTEGRLKDISSELQTDLKAAYPGSFKLILDFLEEFRLDDWKIRDTLLKRPDIGDAGLAQVLNQFRRAYIQEVDLDILMRLNINFIRLPLYIQNIRPVDDSGQWLTEQFDFSAVDRLVSLCADRGIYVLLDLHGAPGCQSNEFHTGRKDFNRLFNPADDSFRQRTVEFWLAAARHYKNNTAILGYDILNEPYGAISEEYYPEISDGYAVLWTLYGRIYNAIREVPGAGGAGDTNHLIVMEGIPSDKDWETLPDPGVYNWSNVMYQFHYYGFNFDENGQPAGTKSYSEHVAYLNDKISNSRQKTYNVPVLIGEFNGFSEARIWELLMSKFNAQGWNWGMWSYKMHDGASDWGLYTHAYYDESNPDIDKDSLPELTRKMSKYTTAGYHKPHNSLINILRGKARLPGYIHDLKAAKGNGLVSLKWSAPFSVSPITKYRVRYGTVASGRFNKVYNDNATPGAVISGLSNGVNYQFRVEAVSQDGPGPVSNTATARPGI